MLRIHRFASGNQYTLVGTEGFDLVGRLIAGIFTLIFGWGLLISFNPAYIQNNHAALIYSENLASDLTRNLTIGLIVLIILIGLLTWLLYLMVANFITALLDLRGVARVAMEVFLLRFVPGMGTVVLLIAAWPVSQFVLTPAIITLLKSPSGLWVYGVGNQLLVFLLFYMFFSLLACEYWDKLEFKFDENTKILTVSSWLGLPLFVGLSKQPHNNNWLFTPFFHLPKWDTEYYQFSLRAIRSVQNYQQSPTLAMDVMGTVIYLPTVKHSTQASCDQTLAALANFLGVPQEDELAAPVAQATIRVPQDVLKAITKRVLPLKGEEASLVLLVASALTQASRDQYELRRHRADDPDLLLRAGIATLGAGDIRTGLQYLTEAERLCRLKFKYFKQITIEKYLKKAQASVHQSSPPRH
ncbi:hypothetical protein BRW62_08180 [Parathermosynechococcus lividus PCC 6715]|uniref:Uncharacterized protein n=1 Tax=Parathermosynechococcus lividus PCC 6715 TaxID=1917166 RepID=A0A2D2Q2T0_PARLV|nr:hypothetical protein BRW62_08180 [Thermostichus lividus PCC 6715]